MRTKRAVLLPFPGDPFLLHYWLDNYRRVWSSEVDEVYVLMNSSIEEYVVEYVVNLCKRFGVNFKHVGRQMEHGEAISELLSWCAEDYIMLAEDDCFVVKPGPVGQSFERIESGEYDIVGSKRASCSMEISKQALIKWGIGFTGAGDQGCNFWPAFFFCKKELLLKTDGNYAARAWKRGETIEALKHIVEDEIVVGDTFVNTSLQLHNMVAEDKIHYQPQYHAHPDDYKHYQENIGIFDGRAAWVHIGSLSSGVGGILQDDNGRSLAKRTIEPPLPETILPKQWCQSEMEKMEFERRVQWWLTFYEEREVEYIPGFADLYIKAIDRIIEQFKLNRKNITRRQAFYKERLGL